MVHPIRFSVRSIVFSLFVFLLSAWLVYVPFLNFHISQAASQSELFSDIFENTKPQDDFITWTSHDSDWSVVNSTNNGHNSDGRAVVTGNSNGNERILLKTLDATGFENITLGFWYNIPNSKGFEPESTNNKGEVTAPADHVYFEWSLDGSSWIVLRDFNDSDLESDVWTQQSFTLSGANNASQLSFRFRASLNASSSDQLQIDDVQVFGEVLSSSPSLSPSPEISLSPSPSPSPSPSASVSPSQSPSPSSSPTESPSPSPSQSVSPSPSISPSPSPSPSPSESPSPSPTIVPTPTATPLMQSSIAGTVFNDVDGDGDKDQGEPGLESWMVQLYDSLGETVLSEQATNSLGEYLFINLSSGTYFIKIVLPTHWTQTLPEAASFELNVGENQSVTDVNFGSFQAATVSGFKFYDRNADGTWQQGDADGESAVSGWMVIVTQLVSELATPSYKVLDVATTIEDGTFTLYAPLPGLYRLFEEVRNDWLGIKPTVTGDPISLVSEETLEGSYDTTRFIDVHVTESGELVTHAQDNSEILFGNVFFTSILGIPFGALDNTIHDARSALVLKSGTIELPVKTATTSIDIVKGTIVSADDESVVDFTQLGASGTPVIDSSGFAVGTIIDGALQFGLATRSLGFSQPITMHLFVDDTDLEGETLDVRRSSINNGNWTTVGIVEPATCIVTNSFCTFSATKASYYIAYHVENLENNNQNNQSNDSGSGSGSSGSSSGGGNTSGGGGGNYGPNGLLGLSAQEAASSDNIAANQSSGGSSVAIQSTPNASAGGTPVLVAQTIVSTTPQSTPISSPFVSQAPRNNVLVSVSPSPSPIAEPTNENGNNSLLALLGNFWDAPLGKFAFLFLLILIAIIIHRTVRQNTKNQ